MKLRLDDLEKKPATNGNGGSSPSNQQLVKLKAQVKFGEDALRQEQELVKQLQEQLAKQKQVTRGFWGATRISWSARDRII